MKDKYKFDVVYTSVLKRAIQTNFYILQDMDQLQLKVKQTWRLNERHYGGLTGYNKDEMMKKYGKDQV